MLRLVDQTALQACIRILDVRVTDSKRKIKIALRVLVRDVVIAFRRCAVALAFFVSDRTVAECDVVSLRQRLVTIFNPVQIKLALGFFDQNPVLDRGRSIRDSSV